MSVGLWWVDGLRWTRLCPNHGCHPARVSRVPDPEHRELPEHLVGLTQVRSECPRGCAWHERVRLGE